jgi:hypothetical protein
VKTVRELVDLCHVYIPIARDVLRVARAGVYLNLPIYRRRCQSHRQAKHFHDPQNRNRQGCRNVKAVSLTQMKKRHSLGQLPN